MFWLAFLPLLFFLVRMTLIAAVKRSLCGCHQSQPFVRYYATIAGARPRLPKRTGQLLKYPEVTV